MGPPQKTPEGLAELTARSRGLSQRHRTLLLLIDGQRSLEQVLSLAQQAGVPRAYFDELVALGLVHGAAADLQARAADMEPTVPTPLAEAEPPPRPPRTLPPVAARSEPVAAAPLPDADEDDPWHDSDSFGRAMSASELAALDSSDQSLAEARNTLLEALRQEAPVAGALTMLRVRRAPTREALAALLPEVEQKLSPQRHLTDAARIMRRVQQLLAG